MRVSPGCEECLFRKQKKKAEMISDENQKKAFLDKISSILYNRDPDDCAPYLVSLFDEAAAEYLGVQKGFVKEKEEYNSLVMSMENEIEKNIESAADPLETSLIYARIGNYIDFGALGHVETDKFLELLKAKNQTGLDPDNYSRFCRDCGSAGRFVLLCDNCGEIVLDKLFLRQLKKRYPEMQVDVIVRGQDVLNDATMQDAVFCRIDSEANIIENGSGIPGTVIGRLSKAAEEAIAKADVILAKGQGNYESMAGCGKNVYYSFLCKCELFTTRFQVEPFTGMFVHESYHGNV